MKGKGYKRHIFELLKERDGLVCGICKCSLEEEWKLYEHWLANLNVMKADKTFIIKRNACNLTIDHKIPASVIRKRPDFVHFPRWRWADLENLQLAHLYCNIKKGDSLPRPNAIIDYVPPKPIPPDSQTSLPL